MNHHLDQAAECISRSDASLLEAAEHIRQAMHADPHLTFQAAGEYLGRSRDWIRALLQWAETAEDGETLFSHDTNNRLRRATNQGLRDLADADLDEAVNANSDRVEAALERVRIAAITADVEGKQLTGASTPDYGLELDGTFTRDFGLEPDGTFTPDFAGLTREQMFSRMDAGIAQKTEMLRAQRLTQEFRITGRAGFVVTLEGTFDFQEGAEGVSLHGVYSTGDTGERAAASDTLALLRKAAVSMERVVEEGD